MMGNSAVSFISESAQSLIWIKLRAASESDEWSDALTYSRTCHERFLNAPFIVGAVGSPHPPARMAVELKSVWRSTSRSDVRQSKSSRSIKRLGERRMKEGIEHFFATTIEQCLGEHDMQPPLVAVDPAAFASDEMSASTILRLFGNTSTAA
jgi:hypothetical protein